nr:uncharacterized protein LOC126543635 [Dermacentor andersoni]
MASVKWWILALAVACALLQGCVQGNFLSRFRSCVLPHERRARLWERMEQYCIGGRHLEYRRRAQRCICQPGYYRDEETNNCYDARRCGQCDISKHERFNSCVNDCESVCGKRVIQQCDKPCVPGCECMKGYIRKYKKGPCVPIQTCPPKCPAYMTFEMERERCPRVCNVAREDSCSETNEGPGCSCKKGFVLRAPFGTVRTRVWCIHESMCSFPDEDKGSDRKPEAKRGQSVKGIGVGANSFWRANQGQQDLEVSVPKKIDDDLFLGSKGFPTLGGLGHKEAQGLQLGRDKQHLYGGQIVQGKVVPGSDNVWGWNKGQAGLEDSVPEKVDDDLFQDTKGFPPFGDLGKRKGRRQNLGQEEIGVKSGQESHGTGISGSGNFWGWNNGQRGIEGSVPKKNDEDLYLDVDRFSNLGDLRQIAGEGSQLSQQEVGLKGGQSDNERQVSGSDRFWGWNKDQPQGSTAKQPDNNLYLGDKGFPPVGPFGLENGEVSAFQPDEIGFKGGKGGQKGGALGSENIWGSSKGEGSLQDTIHEQNKNSLYLGTKQFLSPGESDSTKDQGSELLQDSFLGGKLGGASGQWKKIHGDEKLSGLGGLQDEKGPKVDTEDWFSGQQGTETIPDLNKGQEGDEGLMSSKVVEDWIPDEQILQKGGSKKGGLPSREQEESNIPGVGVPVGKLPDIGKLGGTGPPAGIPGVGPPVGELPNIGGVGAKGMAFGGHLISQNMNNENSPGQIEILGYGSKGGKRSPLQSGIEQKTASIDLVQQNEAFPRHLQFPKAAVSAPISVPPFSSLNQQSQNTVNNENYPGQIEILGAGSKGGKGGMLQGGRERKTASVGWLQQNEVFSPHPESTKATVSVPISVPTFSSLNQQGQNAHFVHQSSQRHYANTAQPGAVDWTQQKQLPSSLPQLQRATAPLRFPSVTAASTNQPAESTGLTGFTGRGWQRGRGNTAQPGAVDWTQQNELLSGISQFQRTTAPVPTSGADFGPFNSQNEAMDITGQGAQMRPSYTAQPSVVDWRQQNEPLSTFSSFQTSRAAVPVSGATVAPTHQEKEGMYFTGQPSQARQPSAAQPGALDRTQQNDVLLMHPQFQRQTASVPFSGSTFGPLSQEKQRTGYTDQGFVPFSGTTFGSLNQQSMHFLGRGPQTPSLSTVQPEGIDRTPQIKPLSRFPEFQAATALVPSSVATVPFVTHQNGSTDFTRQALQMRHVSIAQPGAIESVREEEPLSSSAKLQRVPTSVPLSSSTVGSKNEQKQNMNFTHKVSQTHLGSAIKPSAVNGRTQNEPLSRVPELQRAMAAVNSNATVRSKRQTKEKTDSTGADSHTRHRRMPHAGGVNRTQQKKPLSQVPELQKATISAPLSGTTVAFKNQPGDLTGQDSKARDGNTERTGAGSIKTGEGTAGVATNQKRDVFYRIINSGVQLRRKTFRGLPNIFSLGSLFPYSLPVVGTAQLLAGNYPSGYGIYTALQQPFYGESLIPIGYPMFYPGIYDPMTYIWAQRKQAPDDLLTQQQPVMESESSSSPTHLSDQNLQQGRSEVAGGGETGAGASGVPHKLPVGVVPAEENYAFDDRSLDSW